MIEDRADLPNAIALNSSMINGARLIGPSIAGFIIAVAGEGYCFLIDGLAYVAVIVSLRLMRPRNSVVSKDRKNVLTELKEGWRYITRFTPIRSILLLVASISLVGVPYSVLLPIFASEILHGGPHTLGLLTGATGLGAFTSAVVLAFRRAIVGLGRVIAITAFGFGAGLLAFGFSHTLWLSLLLMLVTGFCLMQHMAGSNTIMQTIVDEDKRGRVMSFYTLAFIGVAPFGSLISGIIANRIGAPATVIGGGILSMAIALWFGSQLKKIRKIIRPIYIQLGILPEVATGIQAATALQTPPEMD